MDDNNKKPKKDENSNMNQTKEPSRTNETSTDLLENLQNLHNTLVDIVEPLQESNDSKEKLNLVCNNIIHRHVCRILWNSVT